MAIDAQSQQAALSETADRPDISVVAPAYNESRNLTPLVEELVDALNPMPHSFEIVLVDDGSTDDTGDVIERLAKLFESVVGISLTRNHGQSAAMAAGIDNCKGEIIVTIDADRQNDPADIPDLVADLEDGADCVSGHRSSRRDPWGKRLPSWVQTHLAKRTGPDINDFGCTLKAYRRQALDTIELRGEGHRYIPAMLHREGYHVEEREVNHRPRKHGDSHYGAGRLVRGSVDLLWHWFRNRYAGRPIHLFGAGGVAAMGTGVVIGLVSVIQRYAFGVSLAPRTPRLILVALLVTFGLQLLVFGVVTEMLTSIEYASGKSVYRVDEIVE